MRTDKEQNVSGKIFSNPAYFGKHVVVVGDEVFVASTGEGAVQLLQKARKAHPDKKPILAYVPKEESLILIVWK